mgnify:CR=1 FL=1
MTTVLANGVFDLLHHGHILHLQEAKSMGDKLVVSITADAFVYKDGRPIYPELERMEIVKALR